ncbi:MAG: hypothetical protein IH624_13105 [Phycisphaerae bacterium]|nr:hypothetical protein [Phycisphaerae bacterium]
MYNCIGKRAFISVLCMCALALQPLLLAAEHSQPPTGPSTPLVQTPLQGPGEFALQEFSVFEDEYEGSLGYQLTGGQRADELQNEPFAALKACPKLKSAKPLYGKITFGDFLFNPGDTVTRYFTVDESQGEGKGYDTLYFDLNGDLDLTNDAPAKRLAEPPKGADPQDSTFFDTLKVNATFPKSGPAVFNIMPVLQRYSSDYQHAKFVVPTGRRGTITVGTEQVEAILAQGMAVSGRFDSKLTALIFDQKEDMVPCLGAIRKFGDTLYEFSATPSGDKLTVRPYTGQYGELKLPGGDKIFLGLLMDKERMINVSDCPTQDGRQLVPLGDYAPIRLGIDSDKIRYGLSADIAGPGQQTSLPLIYAVKIRHEKPFTLAPGKDCVVKFNSPTPGLLRYRPGDQFKAEAMLYSPSLGVMISSFEDKSKPQDEMTLPDGTKMQMYASIDPEVKIVNAVGQTVAEGKMPFG